MTARVAGQRNHSPPLLTRYEGNLQELPGGDSLIGWGQQPFFTVFDSRARTVLDGRFVGTTSSYRVYVFSDWTGTPASPPAAAATRSGRTTTVYASWNGSTLTASWLVLSGPRPGALSRRRVVHTAGFETAIRIARAPYVQVRALDGQGHVLGTSPLIKST